MSDLFHSNNRENEELSVNEGAAHRQNSENQIRSETETRYSWNYDAEINSMKKKKKAWMMRAFLVLSLLVTVGILGLAGTGVYYIYNQYEQNTVKPPQAGSNPSNSGKLIIQEYPEASQLSGASDPAELPTEQIVAQVGSSVVGIVSTVQSGRASAEGTGSGIIMSSDGYIITNAHVIDGAVKIKVYLNDGSEYEAKKIGSDSKTDLAVIKIEVAGLSAAVFGNSDQTQVGSRAIAIGSPYSIEFAGTVTQGVISAINRDIEIEGRSMSLLQTDASINPGNSGGPLINKYGQIIGINSLKIASSQFEGLGFAIPINNAQPIVNDLIEVGYVKGRPLIGISGEDIGNDMRAMLYGEIQGVRVAEIDEKSNAGKAGLLVGDIIVKVDGEIIKNMKELNLKKDMHSAGDTITLTVYRNQGLVDIEIVLLEFTPS